jgi:hypothetical protein
MKKKLKLEELKLKSFVTNEHLVNKETVEGGATVIATPATPGIIEVSAAATPTISVVVTSAIVIGSLYVITDRLTLLFGNCYPTDVCPDSRATACSRMTPPCQRVSLEIRCSAPQICN